MKTSILLLIFGFTFLTTLGSFTYVKTVSSECDVKSFYEAVSPSNTDTKVITKDGDLEEIEYILVPKTLNEGKYKISLTRKGSNIYRVDNTKLWIETRYCYEYATYDDVILIVESSYGYTKGKIIF